MPKRKATAPKAPSSKAPSSKTPGSRAPSSRAPGENAPNAEEDVAVEPSAEEGSEPAGIAAVEQDDDPLARLEAEATSHKDQLLRALAEIENLRRRSQREREDAVKYAAAPLIRDLIGVADNLARALDSVPAGASDANEPLERLLAGVEMTQRELNTVFDRHFIVKIDPLGEPFDPHLHEAMFEIPDPEAAAGTVLQVLQAGYRLRDRLLRPAQVGIAKGAPAAAGIAPEPSSEPEPEPTAARGGPEPKPEPEIESKHETGAGGAPGSRLDTTA